MTEFVFVLAQNLKEAEDLRDHGCGYETEAAAKKARSSPEIDSYYRNLMKVYKLVAEIAQEEAKQRDAKQRGEGRPACELIEEDITARKPGGRW